MLPTHRIPAELANQAVAEAVASCAKQGYAETAVVVDADGVDRPCSAATAPAATRSTAPMTRPTRRPRSNPTPRAVRAVEDGPGFANLFTQLPHLILLGGGIVIKVGDEVVGAIGAGGRTWRDLDDACAHAGLDKIRDQLK